MISKWQHDENERRDRERLQRATARSREVLEGVAIGGPSHGNKISASRSWDGIVQGHFDHRYVWSDEDKEWVWHPDNGGRKPGRGSPGARRGSGARVTLGRQGGKKK